MWLKYVKGSLLGLSLFAGLASVASGVSAATVTIDGSTKGGTGVGVFTITDGTAPSDVQELTVSENSVWDITVTSSSDVGGPITGLTLENAASGGTVLETGVADGSSGYTLRYSFVSGTSYYLNTALNANEAYQISISAVPLPAAAWMFLSMLFGGAWIKRRGARSKGGVVATA